MFCSMVRGTSTSWPASSSVMGTGTMSRSHVCFAMSLDASMDNWCSGEYAAATASHFPARTMTSSGGILGAGVHRSSVR